jgi:aubergine-like protein
MFEKLSVDVKVIYLVSDEPSIKVPLIVCCSDEGLADDVRADFRIMKDLAVHTRIGPQDRVRRLQKFITDINR